MEQLAERLRKTKTDGADGAEGAGGEGLYDDALALVRYLRARPGSFHISSLTPWAIWMTHLRDDQLVVLWHFSSFLVELRCHQKGP